MMNMAGMTAEQIKSRVRPAGSYLNLKQDQIVKIVGQLSPEQQKKCFYDAKKIEPIGEVDSAGIMAICRLNEGKKPISQYTVDERRKIIKENIDKEEVKQYLEANGLLERARILKTKNLPGDFRPSGLLSVLDELLPNFDLSDPNSK